MCKGTIALNIYLCSKTAEGERPQSHIWKETSQSFELKYDLFALFIPQNHFIQFVSHNNLQIILNIDWVLQMCDYAALNIKTVISAKKLRRRATVCNVSRETERIKDVT